MVKSEAQKSTSANILERREYAIILFKLVSLPNFTYHYVFVNF
jgi:hypothetical protein